MQKITVDFLAGFFDGEGCVGVYKHKNSYHLSVSISNTSLEILELIQKDYGGNIYKSEKSGYNKSIFRLTWYGGKAQNLLLKISDKLIIKKQKAELTLCFPTIEQKMLQSFNKEIMESVRSAQNILYLELKKIK